ncbi:MAG: nucleotidyltransferase family protein [Pseudomonadota bacterium]
MTSSDWEAFAALATTRHKVAPLVSQHLAGMQAPAFVVEHLAAAAQRNAMVVLQQVAHTRAVLDAFRAEAMSATVLKGWPLSEDLFGSSSLRQARDIDLILDDSEIPRATEMLLSLGFSASSGDGANAQSLKSASLFEERNNLSFSHAATGVLIELHWRCHQFYGWPELFRGGKNTHIQTTSVGPVRVPTEQANLVYLSVHGSLHRWARLKWLCDIAVLAKRRGPIQLEQDLEFARELGAGKSLALGLSLSARLLGSPRPPSLRSDVAWLERTAIEEINREEEIPSGLAHRAKFYAMTLALAESMRQRLGVLRYRFWGKPRLALNRLRTSA